MAGNKGSTRLNSAQGNPSHKNTIRAALYSRVSTTNGQDPEMQLRELREYFQRRGWTVVQEYVDAGISGSREKRPQLDTLIADAHRRRLDAVVVWRFDRFARSVSHLLRALETFRALGVEFVSLSNKWTRPRQRVRWCSLFWVPSRNWSGA